MRWVLGDLLDIKTLSLHKPREKKRERERKREEREKRERVVNLRVS